MAIQISGRTVIDNSRNVTNVLGVGTPGSTIYGNGSNLTGISTVGGLGYYSGNVVATSPITLTSADVNKIILVNTSSARNINLPAGSGVPVGSLVRIVDVGNSATSSGNASSASINIIPNASDQINGAGAGTSFSIDINGGYVELIWAGSTYDWRIVG
jgi:hypothetical protein